MAAAEVPAQPGPGHGRSPGGQPAESHPLARAPELGLVLTPAEIRQTADAIAAMQEPDGAIPWPDGHTEAWDHLECTMALELGGRFDAAERAWEWLLLNQRPDGSWPASTVGGIVKEEYADSNQCAYVATAVWHRWRRTGDRAFVRRLWPVVRAALDFVVGMQAPGGQIWWARGTGGDDHPYALLTGCSSILHSLRCGLGVADLVGETAPGWELAASALAHALRAHPEYFAPTHRWSMDWYYPVIGGALRGVDGVNRLRSRWDDFVIDGLGIRCVDDEPWVTGAETCELAIALHLVGETVAAATMVRDMQHLRDHDGAYWTGWQFQNGNHYPPERSSWTAAAVVLAVDTLAGGVTEAVFRGDDLPPVLAALAPGHEALAALPAEETRGTLDCGCDPAPVVAAWSAADLDDQLAS